MSGFKGVAAGRDGPVHTAANDPPGASWNYRVIEFVDFDNSPWFSIHEVRYHDGKPYGYGETPADASSEDHEGIAWVLEQMGKALLRPVLRERDFSGGALIVGPVLSSEVQTIGPSEASAGNAGLDDQTISGGEGKGFGQTIPGPQCADAQERRSGGEP